MSLRKAASRLLAWLYRATPEPHSNLVEIEAIRAKIRAERIRLAKNHRRDALFLAHREATSASLRAQLAEAAGRR